MNQLTLSNRQVAWHFAWERGTLTTARFDNHLSGLRFALCGVQEVGLVFSGAIDRVAEPLLRVTDFTVRSWRRAGREHVVFALEARQAPVRLDLHFALDGPTRRKWIEVTHTADGDLLLLDVELDDFTTDATTTAGAAGQPVFIEDEAFAAIEHPAGTNQGELGRVRLAHYPGRRLSPGETFRSRVALVSVAAARGASEHFLDYIQARSVRSKQAVAIYTPFGINNQWGSAPTLDDEESLEMLDLLETWRRQGVKFDFFTLDTGWVDYNSDLTRFRPVAFPHGPKKLIERVEALGMKFGLWFATSWGLQSCWDYPAAFPSGRAPKQPYREGFALGGGGVDFCLGEESYFSLLKRAVLHHVRENHVRFLKFDGGYYFCENPAHAHLPGKYSVEPMYEKLIDIADSARAISPDVFVMWYWGLRSPFWAMHGDMIFESGLHMEGSATSPIPTLYYRDSVTLAQDQNAQVARTIPPIVKDSLGVWLSDSRWGNFMGKERWRETLVMDLGRGNLLFPNLWGNLHHLTPDDVRFLARMAAIARQESALFQRRRNILGDPFHNDVYGYANTDGRRGFLFFNNVHFTARRVTLGLDRAAGFTGRAGTPVEVVAHFPERQRLLRPDGAGFRLGDVLDLWLRPFETLMLEVGGKPARAVAARAVDATAAAALGQALELRPATWDDRMDLDFVDAATFAAKQHVKKTWAFETVMPDLEGEQPILAIVVRLRQGAAEWKYAPTVVQITQALLRVGDQNVQLIPVPTGRQFGNTQSYGASWVVWKVRLGRHWSHAPVKIALHAWLPQDVEAKVETWITRRWWQEDHRAVSDGHYTYAPS